jgi:hypothetical protein
MNLQLSARLFLLYPLCLGMLLSISLTPARAEELSRHINVTGTAEVKVAPDEAVLSLVIETTNKNIREAIKENEQKLKKLTALLEKHGIDPKQIQTGLIQVAPVCEQSAYPKAYAPLVVQPNGQQAVPIQLPAQPADVETTGKEYKTTKSVTVRSKELAKLEELLTAVYESGFATVQSMGYQNTAQKKIQDTLRTKAIQAAREKAEALTFALGQKIGKAIRIEESGSGYTTPAAYAAYPSAYSAPPVYVVGGLGQTPEQITVSASVTVWFELP